MPEPGLLGPFPLLDGLGDGFANECAGGSRVSIGLADVGDKRWKIALACSSETRSCKSGGIGPRTEIT